MIGFALLEKSASLGLARSLSVSLSLRSLGVRKRSSETRGFYEEKRSWWCWKNISRAKNVQRRILSNAYTKTVAFLTKSSLYRRFTSRHAFS